jgi:hypothetical protein
MEDLGETSILEYIWSILDLITKIRRALRMIGIKRDNNAFIMK